MVPTTNKRYRILKILIAIVGIPSLCIITLGSYLYFQIHHTNGEIISSGQKRTYLLYVPTNYQPERPSPLVICIHGYAQWPAHQMEISHWNHFAEENNIIIVYPSGTGTPLHWRTSGQVDTSIDVQFISDLIDKLQKDYNIDETRIYANGLSNGGGMSFVLSCNLSDRIAAISSVAGAYLLPWEDCNPEHPVPAIIFHGTDDPIVPFDGGPSSFFNIPFPEISNWVRVLAAQNGCSENPIDLPVQGDVRGKRFINCAQNAEVLFYTIDNGGHSWPGGGYLPKVIVGYTTEDIDATRMTWEFFQQHPMEE
jgi:polyhydroxybutyrate depolymerase